MTDEWKPTRNEGALALVLVFVVFVIGGVLGSIAEAPDVRQTNSPETAQEEKQPSLMGDYVARAVGAKESAPAQKLPVDFYIILVMGVSVIGLTLVSVVSLGAIAVAEGKRK